MKRWGKLRFGRKHPHGRGEDVKVLSYRDFLTETPPRAWGRQDIGQLMDLWERNTPTGVGKTTGCAVTAPLSEKHPHGRGEDTSGT